MSGSRAAAVLSGILGLSASHPAAADLAVLEYCGYIGGAADDLAVSVAFDAAGNAYVAGETGSSETTFPSAVGPDLGYNGGRLDAFVAKVRADGTGLAWAGYIGGSDDDAARDIAVDGAGNALVVGRTESAEDSFPASGGFDPTFNGGADGFVARVRADGTGLAWASYIGGAQDDDADAVAVGANGDVCLAGRTASDDFPARVGPDLSFNGGTDAFVARLRGDGTGLEYAGYLGGALDDRADDIVVDAGGDAYVTGWTGSSEGTFPVIVGPDITYNGGWWDAFVARVAADGATVAYNGFIGGSGGDPPSEGGHAIAVDASGHAYVTGHTASSEATFPVTVGPDLTFNGSRPYDAFVAKVWPDGSGLAYAGYIGGSDNDAGNGIAVDCRGNAYIAGGTGSSEATFPVLGGPGRVFYGGLGDGYVAKVSPDGSGLLYAGYIGGDEWEIARFLDRDAAGRIYLAGYTRSSAVLFPVQVGPDLTHNGGFDAFVARLTDAAGALLPVGSLSAIRPPLSRDDVAMSWQSDPGASGYNVWYVDDKGDIPDARRSSSPPAVPVAGCAWPTPAGGTACTDVGSVSRGSATLFFYQVRAFCDPGAEGP